MSNKQTEQYYILSQTVVQFSSMDDFIRELQNRPTSETARHWLVEWRTGSDMVQTVWRAVTCQGEVLNNYQRPSSIVQVSLVIGTYAEINGEPFGPQAERRAEIIQEHEEEAVERVSNHLVEKLPVMFRVAGGAIFTGLKGSNVQPAYWPQFDHIYDKLRELGQ